MIVKLGEVEWKNIRSKIYARPKEGACPHLHLEYLEHGELLLCSDCKMQISARWALEIFFGQYEQVKNLLDAREAQLKVDEEKAVIHRAALAVQHAWRKKHLVPTCPHCGKGIKPCDGLGKRGAVNPDYYNAKPLEMKPNLALVGE
jgi:5-methylcytosine-specific restriction endonuclease McrA